MAAGTTREMINVDGSPMPIVDSVQRRSKFGRCLADCRIVRLHRFNFWRLDVMSISLRGAREAKHAPTARRRRLRTGTDQNKRSKEHSSEHQSLMRTSYADF